MANPEPPYTMTNSYDNSQLYDSEWNTISDIYVYSFEEREFSMEQKSYRYNILHRNFHRALLIDEKRFFVAYTQSTSLWDYLEDNQVRSVKRYNPRYAFVDENNNRIPQAKNPSCLILTQTMRRIFKGILRFMFDLHGVFELSFDLAKLEMDSFVVIGGDVQYSNVDFKPANQQSIVEDYKMVCALMRGMVENEYLNPEGGMPGDFELLITVMNKAIENCQGGLLDKRRRMGELIMNHIALMSDKKRVSFMRGLSEKGKVDPQTYLDAVESIGSLVKWTEKFTSNTRCVAVERCFREGNDMRSKKKTGEGGYADSRPGRNTNISFVECVRNIAVHLPELLGSYTDEDVACLLLMRVGKILARFQAKLFEFQILQYYV